MKPTIPRDGTKHIVSSIHKLAQHTSTIYAIHIYGFTSKAQIRQASRKARSVWPTKREKAWPTDVHKIKLHCEHLGWWNHQHKSVHKTDNPQLSKVTFPPSSHENSPITELSVNQTWAVGTRTRTEGGWKKCFTPIYSLENQHFRTSWNLEAILNGAQKFTRATLSIKWSLAIVSALVEQDTHHSIWDLHWWSCPSPGLSQGGCQPHCPCLHLDSEVP